MPATAAQPAQNFGRGQKFGVAKMLDFRQMTLFLFGISPRKAQNDYIFRKFGGGMAS